MRFTEFEIILEQETEVDVETDAIPQRDSYIVLVLFKNGERIRIGPIPTPALQSENFVSQLQSQLRRDYPDYEMDEFFIEGPGGQTYPITAISPIPDPEGELPADSADSDKDDIGQVDPPEGGEETPPETEPEEVEPEVVEPEDEPVQPETPEEIPFASDADIDASIVDENEYLAQVYNANVSRLRDEDGDYRDDRTGELVPRARTDGKLVDENGTVVGTLADVDPELLEPAPLAGAGSQGGDSAEGLSGEEGALTGDQQEAIESIIEQLRRSLRGAGTNESGVFNALRRIESPEHFEAVLDMYEERYGSKVQDHIITDYQYQPRMENNIGQINRIIEPFGYRFAMVGPLGMALEFRRHIPGTIATDQSDGVIEDNNADTYDPIKVAYEGLVYYVRVYPNNNNVYVSQKAMEDQPIGDYDLVVTDRNLIDDIDEEIQRRADAAFGNKPDGVAPENEQIYFSGTYSDQEGENAFFTIYLNGQRYAASSRPRANGSYIYYPIHLFPPGVIVPGSYTFDGGQILDNQNIIAQIVDEVNRTTEEE